MFLRRATVFVLAGVFAACSGDQGNQAEEGMAEHAMEMATPEQALQNFAANYAEHTNLGHPDMVAALYADSAVVLAADGTIAMGKEQILPWLQRNSGSSPNLVLTPAEQMVEGDLGLQRGTYQITLTPAGGAATPQSGGYFTMFKKYGDEWKIDAVLTNVDAAPPADFPWVKYEGEAPPENGTMKDVAQQWATHFNLGHANMVADLYADDAKVSFSDGPLAEGRAAIEAGLTAAMGENKPQITIHDVNTMPFGTDHIVDVGWWETTVGGKPERTGEYMILAQKAADGTTKILWHYSNGRPGGM